MNTINTDQLINFLLAANQSKIITISNLYQLFLNKLKLNNRAGTINAYKENLKPIMKYLNDNNIFNSNQITTTLINQYVSIRYGKVKNCTINREICSLKTMLNFALNNDYINEIPFKYKKLKETKSKIESIDKKDIEKILQYFKTSIRNKKYILAFMLILTTGIRTNELINIKNKNIDLENMIIKLDFTKNGKDRKIYIINELKELIINIKNNNEYLFNDKENNQMTCNNIRKFFQHIKKELDIKILSPHKLRHYYATNIYNKSLDIYLTCQLLGHSDIKMTQIYLDIDEKDNQNKHKIYNPLNYLTH